MSTSDIERRLGALQVEGRKLFKQYGTDYARMPADVKSTLDRISITTLRLEEELIAGPMKNSSPWQPTSPTGMSGSGLAKAALDSGFDLKAKPAVQFSAFAALTKASTFPDFDTLAPPPRGIIALGADRRFLFPHLPTTDAGVMTAIADWTATTRTLTGNPIRALDAVTEKATLDLIIEHGVEDLVQIAVVIPGVPNALLEASDSLQSFLAQEGTLQIEMALDGHVIHQIDASTPPFGLTGTDLVAQVRNAIASMRAAGANPDLLVLDPADATSLDLTTVGADGLYLFGVRDSGSSTPLWGVSVIEAASMVGHDPLLIDSAMLGQLFLSTMRIEANPYSQFSKNLTDLRVECTGLYHVRNGAGVRRIAAA